MLIIEYIVFCVVGIGFGIFVDLEVNRYLLIVLLVSVFSVWLIVFVSVVWIRL